MHLNIMELNPRLLHFRVQSTDYQTPIINIKFLRQGSLSDITLILNALITNLFFLMSKWERGKDLLYIDETNILLQIIFIRNSVPVKLRNKDFFVS